MQRAKLTPFMADLQTRLPELLSILKQADQNWYPSIFLERRLEKQFSLNHKSQKKDEQLRAGIVMRLYDGYTMHEDASNALDFASLRAQAEAFVQRVKKAPRPQTDPKYYQAPTWQERLQGKYEEELLCQIPENPSADTPVHFGVPLHEPLWENDEAAMRAANEQLQALMQHNQALPDAHVCKNPDYYAIRLKLCREEFVFIDSETMLSQTLLRNHLVHMLMKNGELAYAPFGGLGGRETIPLGSSGINDTYAYLEKLLKAEKLKPGRYKVLLGPDVTGTFAHEAFGHSAEGDTCARGRSMAWDLYRSQQAVGNKHATILNNPAIYQNAETNYAAWGSYYFDEEGWLASEQYLVKEGRLQAPMTNLTSAIRLNVPRSANGKREDWSHGVYTRQTNTYFSAGDKTLRELIEQIDYGFLATEAAGGMEDPKGMGIQVGLAFLEEIKDGKLTGKTFLGPSGGAVQMTGHTPDYLNSIIDKSKIEYETSAPDSARHPFNRPGGCGKYHKELVYAGTGGPFILVDNVLLG